jgi:hypothetical protein
MQYSTVSDTTGTDMTISSYGPTVAKHAFLQDARCFGYDVARTKSNAASVQTSTFERRRERTVPVSLGPARRDAIARALLRAKKEAEMMRLAATSDDPVELSNAGFKLLEQLDVMWEFREEREDDWGDLLNLLQGVLCQEEFERFTSQQCVGIETVVRDYLGGGAVGTDEIERSLSALAKAGFNPWRPLSFPEG